MINLGIKHPEQVVRTPNMFAEYRELPPGPAFIPASDLAYRTTDPDYFRSQYGVPEGYIWQAGSESTGAGWVRPLGKPVP